MTDPQPPGPGRVVEGSLRARVDDLLGRFTAELDARHVDAWAELFHDGARLETQTGTLQGRDELLAFAAASTPGVHLTGVATMTSTAAGRVLARSPFLFTAVEDGRVLTGWYTDTIVDDGQVALFETRRIEVSGAGR